MAKGKVAIGIEKGIVVPGAPGGMYKLGGKTFSIGKATTMVKEKDERLQCLSETKAPPKTFFFMSNYLDTTLPRLVKEASLDLIIRSSRPAPSGPLILPR